MTRDNIVEAINKFNSELEYVVSRIFNLAEESQQVDLEMKAFGTRQMVLKNVIRELQSKLKGLDDAQSN